jgi:hypothetical protein
VIAHAGAADESLSLFFVLAGAWAGWVAITRIRGQGFGRLPVPVAYGVVVVAVGVMVGGLVLPRRLLGPSPPRPSAAGGRPVSTAALEIERPRAGQVVWADDLEVVLQLEGGRVVDATTTTLTADTGHIHLALDGSLVSMTYGVVQVVDVQDITAGDHILEAEFVAADHAPFDPRVVASVTFRTEAR